jgi:hypothetical protein
MKPTQYITARMVPMRDYYNCRVPKNYKERKIMTTLLLASTAAISIIAFADALDPKTAADASQPCIYDAVEQTWSFTPVAAARNMSMYTTLVAGLASCLTAWQEFKVSAVFQIPVPVDWCYFFIKTKESKRLLPRQGTDRKLNRYSSAIFSIKSLMLWWDSLSAVDQASQLNISRLVTAGEAIRTAEVQAWAGKQTQEHNTHSSYRWSNTAV